MALSVTTSFAATFHLPVATLISISLFHSSSSSSSSSSSTYFYFPQRLLNGSFLPYYTEKLYIPAVFERIKEQQQKITHKKKKRAKSPATYANVGLDWLFISLFTFLFFCIFILKSVCCQTADAAELCWGDGRQYFFYLFLSSRSTFLQIDLWFFFFFFFFFC